MIPDRKNWIGVFGLTTDFTEIARIAQELGLMRYVQFFSIETPPPRLVGRGLPEGTLVFSVFNPDDSRSELMAFRDAYTKANPGEGEPRAAEIFAYSSMHLLAHAMEEISTLSRSSLAFKLQQLTSRGPQGQVARFDFDNFRNLSAVHELWVSQGQLVTRRPTPIGVLRRLLAPFVIVLVIIAVVIYAVRHLLPRKLKKIFPRRMSAPALALVITL